MTRSKHQTITFGIQGGKGSFNQQALQFYTKREGITQFNTKYLYTTHRVLKQLDLNVIDYGIFAIQNSVGGVVEESVHAMGAFTFHIVDEFHIPIQHFMMRRRDAQDSDIHTVMTHPQVIKQCKDTLAKKYASKYAITSGEGDLIDHAVVAQRLSEEKLPKSTAVIGPKVLADLYDFEIMAENLQDDATNNTTFFVVKK